MIDLLGQIGLAGKEFLEQRDGYFLCCDRLLRQCLRGRLEQNGHHIRIGDFQVRIAMGQQDFIMFALSFDM